MTTDIRKQWAEDARTRFENRYERLPQWEIGRPQPIMVELEARGAFGDTVLDAGCGSGDIALYLAERGHRVWGLDISPTAIGMAREKARMRSIPAARFLVGDALAPDELGMTFDTVIDSGFLHSLTDPQMELYAASTLRALNPGGTFHALCFSEHQPGDDGPRRVKRTELESTFGQGWCELVIEETIFVTNIHRDGARAYIVSARRA